MDRILLVNACTRPCSRTMELTRAVLEKLDGCVAEVRLYEMTLPALNLE